MANFPEILDDFTPKVDDIIDVMAADVNGLQTAIAALQTKVGADSSAVTSSHDYKIAQLQSGKQATLVSGTNIKTINSESLLGGGNIEITGGSGAVDWIAKSSAYTAENGDGILADTSGGAWTLTLPSSPSVGDVVGVSDSSGSFATNNLTIANNGSKIMGASENLVIDINDASFLLVYTGSTDGWKLDTYMPYGSGISKATGTEVNTGTDNEKMVTSKAIADSDYIKDSYLSSNNYQQIEVSSTEPSTPTTGDLWLDIA